MHTSLRLDCAVKLPRVVRVMGESKGATCTFTSVCVCVCCVCLSTIHTVCRTITRVKHTARFADISHGLPTHGTRAPCVMYMGILT